MKNNKKYRADRTYMIRTDITDNPKLGAKALSDGRESLFLDFNYGYSMAVSRTSGKTYAKKHRRREYLKLYL
ncbi:MAG: site-specific integrase, partial [Muribaculaceae bacterium]|nr:site-specific integrase [Muribaculaceae bacterium]